jgi:mRNA interferase HicA
VKGSELLRLLRKLARRRDWTFDWRPELGKGSHGRLLINGRRTVIPDLKREVKTGTLIAILKDLSIDRADLDHH